MDYKRGEIDIDPREKEDFSLGRRGRVTPSWFRARWASREEKVRAAVEDLFLLRRCESSVFYRDCRARRLALQTQISGLD